MFVNYFKTAWRNLWKNRFYTGINIVGLAIGLATGIIILLWVRDELSYEQFHSKAADIYKVNTNIGTGSSAQTWGTTPAPVGVYGKNQVPAVKNAIRIANNYETSLYTYKEKQFTKINAAFTDPSFFTVFDFKLLKGNAARPFPDNNSVVITSATAKKFFGTEDPIGKIIVADNTYNLTVAGVMQDFPGNSTIRYDMLLPMSILEALYTNGYWKSMNEDWGNYYFTTFLLLKPGSSITTVEQQLSNFLHEHNKEAQTNYFKLQPLTSIHLYGADGNSSAMQMVKIFFAVAVLLLLIACINYVNLSTARSIVRAKEVSIRKIIGAGKGQLFLQFIIETVILFAFATVLAIGIIRILMPLYNNISGKQASLDLTDPGVWITIGITIAATVLSSSIYPALLLSSFKPILALKGKISMGIGNALFRKVLVVSQFTFSVALIIGTLVIAKQLKYIHEKELGYDKSHVFYFNMRSLGKHYNAAKEELLKQPAVKAVSSAGGEIVKIGNTTADTEWDGKEANRMFLIHPMAIDAGFIPMMKLQLAGGSNFTGTKADSTSFILNETAVKEAGITDPIGKRFKLWDTEGTIVGVVKDFHFASLKTKIEPAVFYSSAANNMPAGNSMYIKTTGRDAPKAIAAVTALWKKYNQGFPFEYNFLDETYDRMYKSDQRTGALFNVFAAIAIFISCLGLFGLATYTAQVKIREIGIRKVLGATTAGITGLLTKDFIMLVVIAIAIASPLAYIGINKWLQNFAYRIPVSASIFIVAGFAAVLIALLTVSFQSIKAALANPVTSLRSE